MLEAAEIGSRLSKDAYKKRVPRLRTELVQLQHRFKESSRSLIVIVEGDDREGCDRVLNILNEWMDPRFLETRAFREPTDEELERPRFWRYWRVLPAAGRIGLLSREWNLTTIAERLRDKIDGRELERRIDRIRRFEKTLVDNGTMILKLWFHIRKQDLKKKLTAARKDPDNLWRFQEQDRRIYKRYETAIRVVEELLQETNSAEACWHVIESRCERHRNITAAELVRNCLRKVLRKTKSVGDKKSRTRSNAAGKAPTPGEDPHTILDTVPLDVDLSKTRYERELEAEQTRLYALARKAIRKGRSAILCFEGWDAAGKGGAIRRLVSAMNAQMYRVVPIAAPTDEERAHHYLWRFWRHIPDAGRVVIFDRTWYGRVLVERVEKLATNDEWRRAYDEINEFEEQLVEHGLVVCKFWLHISKDEQLRRFKEREATPHKRFKITPEDYRNRRHWAGYEAAVGEMVARTSTAAAPWHIVPANDKRYARVQVIRTVADALEEAL